MMPPCFPLRRVSRSQRRALCQSCAAAFRDIAANRTGPATLPRHTGQGARVWGNPGKTADIESKAVPPGCSAPARKRLILGALCRCTPKGLAKIGEVGEALDCHTENFPGLGRICRPAFPRRVFAY